MTSSRRLSLELSQAVSDEDQTALERILSRNGEIPDRPDYNQVVEEVLFEASKCVNEEILELLVKFEKLRKRGINERHLRNAVLFGNVKLTESLLKSGAVLEDNLESELAGVYLVVVERYNVDTREHILRLLMRYGQLKTAGLWSEFDGSFLQEFVTTFVEKYDSDAVAIAEILLDSGVPIDQTDRDGFTPLHHSIRSENLELISFLIERGADVDRKNGFGDFPLVFATQCKDPSIVDLLLTANARVDLRDSSGWTALHHACHHARQQRIVGLLLRKGADISAEDERGRTPISLLVALDESGADDDGEDECLNVMVREFSKLSLGTSAVSEKDACLIRAHHKTRGFFETFTNELTRMRAKVFFPPHSYYSVLREPDEHLKKLAYLMKNEDLVDEFFGALPLFPNYRDELGRIADRVIQSRDDLVAVELALKSALGDVLPELVLRKLTDFVSAEDLPPSKMDTP